MTDDKTINAYTTRVAEYLQIPLPPEQIEARLAFTEAVGSGHILDLGSGPGSDSAFFMREGLTVRALDATPAFVEHARENGVDAHLGTFDDVTEVDAYDGIYASFSLLHAPRTDFSRHLAAIHRAMKPEGIFFLGLKLGTGEHRDDLDRYYTYFSQTEIEAALEQTGFTIDRITTGMGTGLAGSYDGFILVLAHA
ncbi:class I SAM-dependent DNA methyltransferase [Ruegeria arenilitoris]|uniref:class I SAM-dependent DNA methyltransferase n=1 Tax=Ruegeria arenilitoris TaxID=1173585 RepID=UPI001479B11D